MWRNLRDYKNGNGNFRSVLERKNSTCTWSASKVRLCDPEHVQYFGASIWYFNLVELEFLAKLKAAPDFGQKTCTFQISLLRDIFQ